MIVLWEQQQIKLKSKIVSESKFCLGLVCRVKIKDLRISLNARLGLSSPCKIQRILFFNMRFCRINSLVKYADVAE